MFIMQTKNLDSCKILSHIACDNHVTVGLQFHKWKSTQMISESKVIFPITTNHTKKSRVSMRQM